jgi:hypothetical protein
MRQNTHSKQCERGVTKNKTTIKQLNLGDRVEHGLVEVGAVAHGVVPAVDAPCNKLKKERVKNEVY